jgi:hypothetical protein
MVNLHFKTIPATHLHIFYRRSQLHGGASAQSGSGRSWIERRALGAMDGTEGFLRTRGLKTATDGAEGHQGTGGLGLQHCSAVDTCHVPIGEAQKYL